METETVPEVALRQLGGRRFMLMTGAVASQSSNELQLRIPRGLSPSKVRVVTVHLEPNDTYTVKAYRIGRRMRDVSVIAAQELVYADMLAPVFERMTGLRTSLGTCSASEAAR